MGTRGGNSHPYDKDTGFAEDPMGSCPSPAYHLRNPREDTFLSFYAAEAVVPLQR